VLEHGRAWDAHHLLIAGNGDVALTTLSGSRMRWIDIDLSMLSQSDREQLQHAAAGRSGLCSCENAAGMQLRAYVALMLHLATRNPGELGGETTRQRIETDAVSRTERALEAGAENGSTLKGERKAFSLARRVEHFMWENVDEPLTLHQICKHMHCRMRSLIYSFKDSFGIGPITYLKILRLNAAHRKLREARGSVRIFDIAASLGFWHMGHFSADYKRMFGMTATETVASARTNPRLPEDRFVPTIRGEL
jgi:AraC family ethanolamine operon transcriptional activator